MERAVADEQILLCRQAKNIETRLQALLDAQSEGLSRGLGAPFEPGKSLDQSTDPNVWSNPSIKSTSIVRKASKSRQTAPKRISLDASRRAIAQSLSELTSLKRRQIELAQSNVEHVEQDLTYVQGLHGKEVGLRQKIRSIEEEDESRKIQEFRKEEETLMREITELENRLEDMRDRRRHLANQISSWDNRIQSHLSSYRTSLNLVNTETNEYLTRPSKDAGLKEKNDESFWKLPPERRTLPMATDHLQQKRQELQGDLKSIQDEAYALRTGGIIWENVVGIVSMVETRLRDEMQRLSEEPGFGHTQGPENGEGIDELISTLHDAQAQIERHFQVVQDKGWNLLTCCVGAELEALVQGCGILQTTRDASHGKIPATSENHNIVESTLETINMSPRPSGSQAQPSRRTSVPQSLSSTYNTNTEDEDEPGPDLLISTDHLTD